MSQYGFPDLESPVSGTELINTHLEPALAAILSSHSGSSRPSYAVAGTIWADTTTNPVILNYFDGTDDIPLGNINTSTNQFIPSNQLKWGGTSGGTANVQTLTPTPALATLTAGVAYEFIVGTPNTSAGPTLNISGTGANTVKYYTSTGKVNVPIGALRGVCRVVYDGTDYILLNARPYNAATAIATATTINLDNATGDYVELTGTTTVTGITLANGQERTCRCAASFTLTDSSGDSPPGIILPGGANITTAAGDVFVVRGETSSTVRVVSYTKADGTAIVAGAGNTPIATGVLSEDDTFFEIGETEFRIGYDYYLTAEWYWKANSTQIEGTFYDNSEPPVRLTGASDYTWATHVSAADHDDLDSKMAMSANYTWDADTYNYLYCEIRDPLNPNFSGFIQGRHYGRNTSPTTAAASFEGECLVQNVVTRLRIDLKAGAVKAPGGRWALWEVPISS